MTNIEFERPPPIDTTFRSQNHLLAKFTIDAFDDKGKYLGRVESTENDLLLNNLGIFLNSVFCIGVSTGIGQFSTLIGRGGLGVTLATYASTPSTNGYFGILGLDAASLGTMVGTGTSTTPPARADSDLGGLLTLAYATGALYNASNQVIASGSNTISNAATVNEAGVYLKFRGGTTSIFLFAHDLVTPGVSVPSMGSASVNWALQI